MTLLLLACAPAAPPRPADVDPGVTDTRAVIPTAFDCTLYDHDGDGWNVCDDCDDTDPTTYPGAPAVCFDGRNNSCGYTEEAPCPFEGRYRLNKVGAKVTGPNRGGNAIVELWDRGAVTVVNSDPKTRVSSAEGFLDPVHTGLVADQGPSARLGEEGTVDFTSVGDVTGDGLTDVACNPWATTGHYTIRPDEDDPTSDIELTAPGWRLPWDTTDFDGDGVRDIAIEQDGAGGLTIFSNLAPGDDLGTEDALAEYDSSGGDPYYYHFDTSSDIDGDGLGDVAASAAPSYDPYTPDGLLGVFLSPHAGTRTRKNGQWADFYDSAITVWHPSIMPPVLADVDDDGRVELLAVASLEEDSGKGLIVVPFTETGVIDTANVRLAYRDASILALQLVDDIDADGHPDLLMNHTGEDNEWATAIYPLPGALVDYRDDIVSFSYRGEPAASTDWPGVADGNNDGVQDFLLGYRITNGSDTLPFFVLYPGGV